MKCTHVILMMAIIGMYSCSDSSTSVNNSQEVPVLRSPKFEEGGDEVLESPHNNADSSGQLLTQKQNRDADHDPNTSAE